MVYIKFGDCYVIHQIKMTAKYSGYMVFDSIDISSQN